MFMYYSHFQLYLTLLLAFENLHFQESQFKTELFWLNERVKNSKYSPSVQIGCASKLHSQQRTPRNQTIKLTHEAREAMIQCFKSNFFSIRLAN